MQVKHVKAVKAMEMIRRFLADCSDQEAGMWLVMSGRHVARILETEMDSLTKEERLRFYGLMQGFFPDQFKRVLDTRLKKEQDLAGASHYVRWPLGALASLPALPGWQDQIAGVPASDI